MKLVTLRTSLGEDAVGVLVAKDRVVDLTKASGGAPEFASMLALIESGAPGLDAARALCASAAAAAVYRRDDIRVLAPIPRPPRMRAMSLDPKHLQQARAGGAKLRAAETDDPAKSLEAASLDLAPYPAPGWFETPVYWFMDHYCVSNPDDHVTWPAYSHWIDYELEIAAVIGKRGCDVPRDAASAYIFGYTIVNDLSARDAQQQATATGLSITAKGKDFEGSYPMGPCIVTADELKHDDMHAILRVNGEEWARGSPKGRHWSFEDGIVYASQACDLIPGELLTSATVANCCGLELARKGARGDCVELEVEEIGVLRTYID